MRVLHLDTGRTLRGGQRQVLLLLRELAALGLPQALLARGPLLAEARARGFETHPFSLWNLARLAPRFSLLHAHDGRSHTLAAVLALRRPLVVARRVAFPPRPGAFTRWKYARAAACLAVSRAVAQELTLAGAPPARIHIVPDAVDLPPRPSSLAGPPVALLMDDPGKCRTLIAALPSSIVRARDLPAALSDARAFIYLSESEGLGSAALLAMAHGVPVIASRRGGLPEAVLDGETGLLVDNHLDDVLAALHRLDHEPGLAAALGAAGRTRAAREFAPAHIAAQTLAIYREVTPQ